MAFIPETYNGMPDPLLLSSTYGIAKRQAEHLCTLYGEQFGLETAIARCFAFVGEDLPLHAHFAIGNFIRDALWHESITVGGDGTPLRSYLDQRDLAHWLICLLLQGQPGQAYNVGSDVAISVTDLAFLVRDTLAPSKSVHILGTPDQQRQRNRYIPSIEKARTELQLDVRIALQQAITHAAEICSGEQEHLNVS
jgi:dTDP-glucose 4,6-dehydratase